MNTFIITTFDGYFITSGKFSSAAQALEFASSNPAALKAMDDRELHEDDRQYNEAIDAGDDCGVFTSEDWDYLTLSYLNGCNMQRVIKTAYTRGFIGHGKELRNARWVNSLKPAPEKKYIDPCPDFDFLTWTDIKAA